MKVLLTIVGAGGDEEETGCGANSDTGELIVVESERAVSYRGSRPEVQHCVCVTRRESDGRERLSVSTTNDGVGCPDTVEEKRQ